MSLFLGPDPHAGRATRLAAAGTLAFGGLGLLGWLLDVPALKSLHGGWIAMAPATAVMLLLLAAAAWPLAPGAARWEPGQRLLTAVALTIGLVSFAHNLLGADVGLGRLLFRAQLRGASADVAPTTAVAILLLSGGRLLRAGSSRAAHLAAESVAVVAGFLAGAILLTYAFGVTPLATGPGATPMAVPTALGLLAACVAIVAGDGRSRLWRVLTSQLPGGHVARWLLPALLITVLLLGWGFHLAGRTGALSDNASDALQTFSGIALICAIVVWSAARLDAKEAERKRADDERLEQERRYRAVFDNAGVGLAHVSPEGTFIQANRRLCEMLGYPSEQLLTRSFQDITHPADIGSSLANLQRLARGELDVWATRKRYVRKDGEDVWVDLTVAAVRHGDGSLSHFVSAFTDVSERRRVEAQLAEQEESLRQIAENIREAFYIADGNLRQILYVSPAYETIWGRSRESLFRNPGSFLEAAHPSDRERLARGFADLRRGVEIADIEFRIVRGDGEIRWILGRSTPLRDAAGEVYRIAGVAMDITDRKRADERLRRSEADYRGLVEQAPIGIFRNTRSGRFLSVNPAMVRMLGYASAEEVLALDIPRDVYTDAAVREPILRALEREGEYRGEAVWKRRDGTQITVRLTGHTVREAGRIEYFEGLAEDVTQQRQLEEQFRQAQRLEAVGRLAGGVAHDFNNILTAITGYSEMLLQDLPAGDRKRQDVDEIRASAKRAADLTRQLLAFSRKQVLQARVLDVNTVVQTLDRMLRRLIGEDVKLELALGSALGAVRADPGQLEQVILNLAVNARDAMPHGGRLTIETADARLDASYARGHPGSAPGRHVMIAVTDSGTGMDAETRAHLFEPFFTTKEMGKGTGLGLATVYGIVRQSGGSVWVYSEPGRGATFKIYLPVVDEPLDAVEDAVRVPVSGGTEVVLLAEDDPAVRSVVADVLGQRGYRVLRAPDGQAALEMARAHAGAIQLLVTDVVMPGMTGRELADALAAERPGLRTVYMSGYTDDAVIRHGVLQEGMAYLQKPFAPDALVAKVREVLDRPAPPA